MVLQMLWEVDKVQHQTSHELRRGNGLPAHITVKSSHCSVTWKNPSRDSKHRPALCSSALRPSTDFQANNDAAAPEQWPLHDEQVEHARSGGCRAEEEVPLEVSSVASQEEQLTGENPSEVRADMMRMC